MIKIDGLYKIYNEGKNNEFSALKDINLTIKNGETVIIKGVSGSGKSTLLSIMGALTKPSRGEIVVGEENIAKLADIRLSNFRRFQIGFIFQSFNLIENLTVEQNIIAPLVLLNLKKSEIQIYVNKAMQTANITHKKDQIVSSLSGGEKQRCAIARALVMKPPIILADEPTANLDKKNSLDFIDMLRKFKELKKSVVIATHDILFDDLDFVDRYLHIIDGELA